MLKSWPGGTEQQPPVFRDHALQEDGQARRARAAAVCSPRRAGVCDHGEVCQACTRLQGTDFLLAGGGCVYRLRDHPHTAGVGSFEISDPEAAQLRLGEHTVVSTDVNKGVLNNGAQQRQ